MDSAYVHDLHGVLANLENGSQQFLMTSRQKEIIVNFLTSMYKMIERVEVFKILKF